MARADEGVVVIAAGETDANEVRFAVRAWRARGRDVLVMVKNRSLVGSDEIVGRGIRIGSGGRDRSRGREGGSLRAVHL